MWIGIGLLCAFLTGTSDALVKQLLAKADERIAGWGKLFFSLPWLLAVAWMAGWPPLLGWRFWAIVAVMLPLEVTAYLCALRSLRLTPISLAIPFQALTPLLTVATAFLFLGERVSGMGLLGIFAVTAGAYGLQAEQMAEGPLEPFRAMFRNPGIRLMLTATFLYSVTATLSKPAIRLSSPAAFPFLYFGLNTLAMTGMARQEAGSVPGLFQEMRSQGWLYFWCGLLTAGSFLTHCIGIRLAPVPYFMSFKRLSLLISVLYGGLVFREERFFQRVLATSLMLSGAALIALSR